MPYYCVVRTFRMCDGRAVIGKCAFSQNTVPPITGYDVHPSPPTDTLDNVV